MLGLVTMTACTHSATPATDKPEPCPDDVICGKWEHGDAAEAGFDTRALAQIAEDAKDKNSTCLAVVKDGKLVEEWNWQDTTSTSTTDVYSVTKSYTSTLIGIAQDEGRLDIDDAVSQYIPQWSETDAANVTIRDILSNDSGRHWSRHDDYWGLLTAGDRTEYAIGLSQDAEPGTTWAYNNSAIQTLDAVLREATGTEPADYAEERLFEPLGMRHSTLTTDFSGNTNMFTGLKSTCQDMARYGHLLLHGGKWGEDQIVSRSWLKAATGKPSQDFNAAYGLLWWLNDHGTVIGPRQAASGDVGGDRTDSRLVSEAPADMYWAVGFGGQVLQVDPGSDTVVVRLGPAELGAPIKYGPADAARVVTRALD